MKHLMLLMSFFLIVGCVPQVTQLYDWQDYSHTLYNYEKAPSEETYIAHKSTLVAIIENAEAKGVKVPPGVCCELGYLYAKEGDNQEAVRYFEQEVKLYPESETFVSKLIDNTKSN